MFGFALFTHKYGLPLFTFAGYSFYLIPYSDLLLNLLYAEWSNLSVDPRYFRN